MSMMEHEKTFILATGRAVKLILKALPEPGLSRARVEMDVLIKEIKDECFRPPIGITHPKYWKLKKLNKQECMVLQMEYSGISEKHVRKALREFEKLLSMG